MQNTINPVSLLLSLHARGQFGEMERQARDLLRSHANVPVLNELLGISLSAQKKFADALPYLQKAVRKQAGDPLFWENLALCQRELRDFVHAEKSLGQALKLRPDNPEALNALGSVLREQKRLDEAKAAFERALALAPDHGLAHFNLGRLLLEQTDLAGAERHLRRAIACGQENALAYRRLGFALSAGRRLAEAEQCFRRAIALDPSDFINYGYLAHVLHELRQWDEIDGLVSQAFERLGDIGAKLNADTIEDIDSLATILHDIRRYDDAMRVLEVTALSPLGDRSKRLSAGIAAARHTCNWPLAARIETDLTALGENVILDSFTALSLTSVTPARQLAIVRAYAAQSPAGGHDEPRYPPAARSRDRLRIGYLSSDFGDHAVSYQMVGAVEAHDRSRFEVIAYDGARMAREGAHRDRMKEAFERFVPLQGKTPEQAMQAIADDRPDILIDLNGWTTGTWTRFLARRAAPLQVQWLGYPGTLGAPWIDYIVADRRLIRPGEEGFYSEKVLALPDSYMPNDDKRESPPSCPRGDTGLPDGAFVFGCFNQSYKLTPELFDVWMRLLKEIPGSVLWLRDYNGAARDSLAREAVARGVDPQRMIFKRLSPTMAGHLSNIPHIDIALDCFPYNSHATGSDMLWMGVPLIGLSGETFTSRVSESMLSAAGLPDLVTRSYEDYFALALRLAREPDFLRRLKARVRASRNSALFDSRRFARNLERGLELIWQRHEAGLPPDHIEVPQAGRAGDAG